jgi:hypothetical protein
MTRVQSSPTPTKIGDLEVEESKMDHIVPERERAEDAINFDGLPSKNAQEIAKEIAISYNPKKPKK